MNSNKIYYKTNSEELINAEFLYEVIRKYHYNDDDIVLFDEVSKSIIKAITGISEVELIVNNDYCDVVLTLGMELDRLSEYYANEDKVLEQYILDNISAELINNEYNRIADIVKKHTGKSIEKYEFFGSGNLPIDDIKEKLSEFEKIQVICNEYMCLIPKKSVIYRIVLSENTNVIKHDITICDDCELGQKGLCASKRV